MALKLIAQAALLAVAIIYVPVAQAAELIMVEETHCPWCKQWNEEVGVIYGKSKEGQKAPLRRINLRQPVPEELSFDSAPRFTPTFILVDNGNEIGRIEGYPGEQFFWGLLNQLLDKLPNAQSGGAAKGS